MVEAELSGNMLATEAPKFMDETLSERKKLNKVYEIIRGAKRKGIQRSQVLRSVQGSGIDARKLTEIAKTLQESNTIIVEEKDRALIYRAV